MNGPRAIAIETSGRLGSVAVVDGGVVRATRAFQYGLQHAAMILPQLDELTKAEGWSPRDVAELYVSIGPGSFTGLRIGVTLAKTMALATGCKIVAVPSVRVLADNAPADAKNVIVVLDAKRGQIYGARFDRDASGALVEVEPPTLTTLAAMLDRAPRPVHLIGEGVPYHRDAITAAGAGVIVTDEATWRARAEVVSTLGHAKARAGNFADPFTLTPIYIRLPEAEEKRLAGGG
jgi:tRNA threonylcarbamoyladenosine biosynthesis protein TsaB